MKNYNEVIKVEVQVNTIAHKLRSIIKDDEKHGDMVTENIIDLMLKNNDMSYLYNSLNGFTNDINFEIDDDIICTDTYWDGNNRKEIGQCTVKEIKKYATNKLLVLYSKEKTDKDGNTKNVTETMWVSHLNCNKIDYSLAH